MKITIDTNDLEYGTLGEVLRQYVFPDKGKLGCYSTFELRGGFIKVDRNSEKGKRLIRAFGWGLPQEEIDEAEFYLFTNGTIDVGWHWDGDGQLTFILEDKLAITNRDCKCCYDWELANF